MGGRRLRREKEPLAQIIWATAGLLGHGEAAETLAPSQMAQMAQ